MKLLEGKVAVVTGAARGIGKAIALKFAQEGANIAFTDLVIDENGLATQAEIEALGVKAKGYASNTASHCPSLIRIIKPSFVIPALFTKISIRPKSFTISATTL